MDTYLWVMKSLLTTLGILYFIAAIIELPIEKCRSIDFVYFSVNLGALCYVQVMIKCNIEYTIKIINYKSMFIHATGKSMFFF